MKMHFTSRSAITKAASVLSLSFVLAVPFAAAAQTVQGVDLYNGGFGQQAKSTTTFGIAICNGGNQAPSQSVPVVIAGNGKTQSLLVNQVYLGPGICRYEYVSYSSFAMQGGNIYNIGVTIDPGNVIPESNKKNNQTTYSSLLVPTKSAVSRVVSQTQVIQQATNPDLANVLMSLQALQALVKSLSDRINASQ